MKTTLIILLLAPLLGALYQIIAGRRFPRRLAEVVSCAVIVVSFVMATVAFFLPGRPETILLYNWIEVDTFSAGMDIHFDALAAIMTLMVTFVSCLITIYSVSYMGHDHDYSRYFAYLNLFVFFMLVIVLADNLLFLFLGWEGVGFCSYALIGFRYEELANARAGRKAFLLTRIGDVGLGIAISLFFVTCHSLSISAINGQAATLSAGTAMTLGFLLFWSATGKSAQLPLLVWLPDAMAGPTPVSALIHAATMVTAGVYLLIRLFPVVSRTPEVLLTIAVVGTVTAFYAACAAIVQKDLKRVLAYSTISQVGYMFLAIGVGDIIGSMFHLLTHAFFKSLLFLAAGAVIHALHDERDISRMGEAVRRHAARRLPGLSGRQPGFRRSAARGRFFQQGENPAGHAPARRRGLQGRMGGCDLHRLPDHALHLSPVFHGLYRQASRPPPGRHRCRAAPDGVGALAPGPLRPFCRVLEPAAPSGRRRLAGQIPGNDPRCGA